MADVTTHHFSGGEAAALAAAGASPRQLRQILATYDTLADYTADSAADHRARGVAHIVPTEVALCSDVWVLVLGGDGYPSQLAAAPAPPVLLYGRGNPAALSPGIAVVGTRQMTDLGRIVATTASTWAAGEGIVVCSGLANGVDGTAHRTVLDAGGVTVAILGCGVDAPMPSGHRTLAEDILAATGAIVAEVPPGTPSSSQLLVARNRIIAYLSSVTLPCEASRRSGTLHTVFAAIDADRSVVVPIPRPSARHAPGAQGLLALADPKGVDPAEFGLTGRLRNKVAALAPVASGCAMDRSELVEYLRLGHTFGPKPLTSPVEPAAA